MRNLKSRISMFVLLSAILILACNKGDQVAPDGAEISLAATPATIPVIEDVEGCSDVVATVYSMAGVPLADQDVRFSSSAGRLLTAELVCLEDPDAGEPAASFPIRTDDLGNARVKLRTAVTTTVTARSGKTTETITLNTVRGDLSSISLELCSGSDTTIDDCDDTICFTALALDTKGVGLAGVVIVFDFSATGTEEFDGSFNPPQPVTQDSPPGQTRQVLFSLDSSTCSDQCGGGKDCRGEIVATTQGGGFQSPPLPFTVNIPGGP